MTPLSLRPSERRSYSARPRATFRQTDIYFPGYMNDVYRQIEVRDSLRAVRERERRIAESRAAEQARLDSLALSDSLASADSLAVGDSLAVKDSLVLSGTPAVKDSLGAADKAAVQPVMTPEEIAKAEKERLAEERIAEKERIRAEKEAAKIDAEVKKIIDKLKMYVPIEFDTYYEPFIGGGAVLFHLQPKKAVINDYNEDLINLYRCIKENLDELIEIFDKTPFTSNSTSKAIYPLLISTMSIDLSVNLNLVNDPALNGADVLSQSCETILQS